MCECLLLLVIIAQLLVSYRERRDLYNRIMCNTAEDYKSITGKYSYSKTKSAHKRTLDKWRKGSDMEV